MEFIQLYILSKTQTEKAGAIKKKEKEKAPFSWDIFINWD